MTFYEVLPGKTIIHAGVEYSDGAVLELSPAHALVHAPNITLKEEVHLSSPPEKHPPDAPAPDIQGEGEPAPEVVGEDEPAPRLTRKRRVSEDG
jgi:hypothetical protein